jgi:orotidine-5'-phosphate decarboxylase
MRNSHSPIILALDTNDVDRAGQWIAATHDSIDVYKVGLEFFLQFGEAGLRKLYEYGDFELFLDLKLHDIPNTVAGAVRAVEALNPKFLTVHASGGAPMIKAAAEAAPHIDITAVTVLTSISAELLAEIGVSLEPQSWATKLASHAVGAGARAIVCSPLEVSAIRAAVGELPTLITPGVRPLGSDKGDQSRVMTPTEAIAAGSDYLVIGRPITSLFEQSPQAMSDKAREIVDSLS